MRIEEEGSERLPSEFAEIRAAGRLRDRLAGIKLGRGLGQAYRQTTLSYVLSKSF